MTPEQQRIAIAEWMGWEVLKEKSAKFKMGRIAGVNCSDWTRLPNYPSDLNAMHEAEKKLSVGQRMSFRQLLFKINKGEKQGYGEIVCHATSQQRSEALCRTLWPERFN